MACPSTKGERADIDGDGRPELVYHSWVKGRAQVGVCFSDGRNASRPGLGQAETMIVLHEDEVDHDVILFGATGIRETVYRLAIWKADQLRIVRDARTNQPLEARVGLDPQTGIAWAMGWDCDRIKAPGTGGEVHGTFVQVKVKKEGGGLKWSSRGYNWRNTDLATNDSSREGFVEKIDPLVFAAQLVEDCAP